MSVGSLMLDIAGYELTGEDREILRHPLVGGVILFARNVESPAQVRTLTTAMRQAAGKPLLIAVDQEGGRVRRFRDGFSPIPAMASVLPAFSGQLAEARAFLRELGWLLASEVAAVGCDFSFAPVLDLGRGISSVIGDRALAETPERVAELARGLVAGMNEAGMAATGKHFPGHGSTELDSHVAMPVDKRSRAAILGEDMRAFRALFDGTLSAVMPAHVIYPEVDARPACFSPVWLRDILRRDSGFGGVIFSDDLSMKGAEPLGDFGERAQAALEAGCDMVLVCNHRDGAVQVIDRLGQRSTPESAERLMTMARRLPVPELTAIQGSARAGEIRRLLTERFE